MIDHSILCPSAYICSLLTSLPPSFLPPPSPLPPPPSLSLSRPSGDNLLASDANNFLGTKQMDTEEKQA
jgi:hypothetical protein